MEAKASSGEVLDIRSDCDGCEACDKRAADDELAFAFLIALMPVITLTLFGNMGLL